MQNLYVGEVIRRRRRELNLSQEALCYGICEVSTLSRIENGKSTPSRSKINALLQRLGLPDERYYAIVSKNEKEVEALRKEIVACNVMHDPKKGHEFLQQLETICEPDDFMTKQFILRSRIVLGDLDGSIPKQKQPELLLQAIRLTVPGFSEEHINDFLYSFDEIKIINQLANMYTHIDKLDLAEKIFVQLIDYINEHFKEIFTGNGILPMILHNYVRVLDLTKQYRKSIQVAELGKQVCIQYGHYQFLPGFIAYIAESYHFLGDDQQSREYYTQAHYLYKALDNKKLLSEIDAEAREYLNLELV